LFPAFPLKQHLISGRLRQGQVGDYGSGHVGWFGYWLFPCQRHTAEDGQKRRD
jgi:hypothetical protein